MTASPSVSEPSASSTSSYTLPPRPQLQLPEEPNLTGTDIDSAYALAKFYFELYPYVKATGDTALWEKYAHPECEFCRKVAERAANDNETGAWTEMKLGILDTAQFFFKGNADYRIDFLIERGKMIYHGSSEQELLESGQNTLVVGIKDENNHLLVRSFDIIGSSFFGKDELP